jgi:guanylate kinase
MLLPDNGALLAVLSGPSGVGKDSVLNRLRARGYPFHFVATVTTRTRRPQEMDGKDYHFVTEAEYDDILSEDGFLEHAEVYDRRYGVPRSAVQEALDRGEDVILRVDVQGAATIKKVAPEAVFIFLMPSSVEELRQRLRKRGANREKDLAVREKRALDELKRVDEFDYAVVNEEGCLDRAADQVESILMAERCRVHRRRITLAEVPRD